MRVVTQREGRNLQSVVSDLAGELELPLKGQLAYDFIAKRDEHRNSSRSGPNHLIERCDPMRARQSAVSQYAEVEAGELRVRCQEYGQFQNIQASNQGVTAFEWRAI